MYRWPHLKPRCAQYTDRASYHVDARWPWHICLEGHRMEIQPGGKKREEIWPGWMNPTPPTPDPGRERSQPAPPPTPQPSDSCQSQEVAIIRSINNTEGGRRSRRPRRQDVGALATAWCSPRLIWPSGGQSVFKTPLLFAGGWIIKCATKTKQGSVTAAASCQTVDMRSSS